MGREAVKIKVTWEYKPGRLNIADPLCRMPMVAGQVVCCALGVACTRKADDGSDIISHIKAGYDAYFAVRKKHEKVCTQRWCVLQGRCS